MLRSQGIQRRIWIVLGVCAASACAFSVGAGRRETVLADSVGGLELTVQLDQAEGKQADAPQVKMPKFNVALRNAGEEDLFLHLGYIYDWQFPSQVKLTLTDAQGNHLHLIDTREPITFGGRIEPLVLPLPTGSAFSFSVEIGKGKYAVVGTRSRSLELNPGVYFLQAVFTGTPVTDKEANLNEGALTLFPSWEGTVQSNQLRFEIPAR
jgi:hypothetical protein